MSQPREGQRADGQPGERQPGERQRGERPAVEAPAPLVQRSAAWYGVSRWLMKVFCRVWFRVRFEHAERVPATGSVLLVANHTSYLDPPLAGIGLRRPVAYLAQSGLARFGPMRLWMRKVGVTLIDRNAPSTAALRAVSDCLKRGEVIGIFPEGTRSTDGRVAAFKSGVEFLARRTGSVVVPVGIEGAFRAMSRYMRWPRPRRIVVRFGQPVTAEQVLAPGGVEALRHEIARLANAELANAELANAELVPPAAEAAAGHGKAGSAAGESRPDSGSRPASVDPTAASSAAASSSASVGGGS